MKLETVVWTLGVVPEEPLHEFPVERYWIVEELLQVVVDELLLDRAIEPLTVCIHLRHLWIRVEVCEVESLHFLREELCEL